MCSHLKSSCEWVGQSGQFAWRGELPFTDQWAFHQALGKMTALPNLAHDPTVKLKSSAEVLTPVKTLDGGAPLQERRAGIIAGQTARRKV